MIEDSLQIGFSKNRKAVDYFLKHLSGQIRPLDYGVWHPLETSRDGQASRTRIRLSPAGHVLGSTIFEIETSDGQVAVFSGDLGPQYAPLLNPPVSPREPICWSWKAPMETSCTHRLKIGTCNWSRFYARHLPTAV